MTCLRSLVDYLFRVHRNRNWDADNVFSFRELIDAIYASQLFSKAVKELTSKVTSYYLSSVDAGITFTYSIQRQFFVMEVSFPL